jgi:NAD(P)-dependent dehydrogenase (short-subunit alcohol dehydrogenase family)
VNLELEGKNVIITGGSSGIGLAVARRFLAEGAHVAVIGRDRDKLDAAVADLRGAGGGRVVALTGDVAKAGEISRLYEAAIAGLGGVDILFNNAGTGSEEKIADAPDERWQYYWDLHVMAAVRMSRLCLPTMAARGGGVIINNASICAVQPLGYEPIYNVTKAALSMLGKCMANEFIGQGIRVNTLNPGLVLTPDWIKTAKLLTKGTDTTWEQYLEKIAKDNAPIGRFAQPSEVADVVVFLASPRASYCMGSSYYVDGGIIKTVVAEVSSGMTTGT